MNRTRAEISRQPRRLVGAALVSLLLGGCYGLLDDAALALDAAAADDASDPADASPDGALPPDAALPSVDAGPCDPGTTGPSGFHYAGTACLRSGCHDPNYGRPPFSAAGTVYNSSGSGLGGATIHIDDSAGHAFTMVSASFSGTGNFYLSSAISYPATVRVSKCPDTASMPNAITSGDCNTCHSLGSRIHLP